MHCQLLNTFPICLQIALILLTLFTQKTFCHAHKPAKTSTLLKNVLISFYFSSNFYPYTKNYLATPLLTPTKQSRTHFWRIFKLFLILFPNIYRYPKKIMKYRVRISSSWVILSCWNLKYRNVCPRISFFAHVQFWRSNILKIKK